MATQCRAEAMRLAARGISTILQSMHTYSRRMEIAYGVSGPQLWLLWTLRGTDGMAVGDLAREMFQHPSTVSRLVDGLERRRMVTRSRVSRDRRVVTVRLTQAGIERLNGAPAPVRQRLVEALETMPDDLVTALAAGLTQLGLVADRAASQSTGARVLQFPGGQVE